MPSIQSLLSRSRDLVVSNMANLNRDNLISDVLPMIGNASYILHSTKFLAPSLFSKICGEQSLNFSNALLINSIFGNMLFLFTRKHMRRLETQHALGYSLFGSVAFNFGSILFWTFTKTYLPENELIYSVFGYLSGLAFLSIARSYFQLVDNFTDSSNADLDMDPLSNNSLTN